MGQFSVSGSSLRKHRVAKYWDTEGCGMSGFHGEYQEFNFRHIISDIVISEWGCKAISQIYLNLFIWNLGKRCVL